MKRTQVSPQALLVVCSPEEYIDGNSIKSFNLEQDTVIIGLTLHGTEGGVYIKTVNPKGTAGAKTIDLRLIEDAFPQLENGDRWYIGKNFARITNGDGPNWTLESATTFAEQLGAALAALPDPFAKLKQVGVIVFKSDEVLDCAALDVQEHLVREAQLAGYTIKDCDTHVELYR